KAALHRGRARLQELSGSSRSSDETLPTDVSPAVRRYAALFNARDWDGVRDMLIDDVRLDVVDVERRRGRKEVGIYFSNYNSRSSWYMVPAILEGREGLAVLATPDSAHPSNFVQLIVAGDRIATIRDYHHIPYLIAGADVRQLRMTRGVSQP